MNIEQFDRETEEMIQDLFLKMRSAATKLRSYYELELELVKYIVDCEKKITAVRDKRNALKVLRNKLIGPTSPKDELRKSLMDIHNKEHELKEFEGSLLRRLQGA